MLATTTPHYAGRVTPWHQAWLVRTACAVLLWLVVAGAHAASVYRCADAQGHVVFRDTPCASHARQTELDLAGQPVIDPGAPRQPAPAHASKSGATQLRPRRTSVAAHARGARPPTSWECRAADGEVFYRHARCPGSVPGDGVVRSQYAEKTSGTRTRGRHDAWSAVRVHGEKIPRSEACRRIHSAGAAGRDGHARDETVSTYDHLTGRDPCGNG